MRNRYWVALILPLFCMLAMGTAKKPPTVEELLERRGVLSDEITSLTASKSCKTDRDCAVIDIGIKPCGGPWKYALFSKKGLKVSVLKRKVAEYNKLDQKINEAQQVMSDCHMTMAPEPTCDKTKHVCIDQKVTTAHELLNRDR